MAEPVMADTAACDSGETVAVLAWAADPGGDDELPSPRSWRDAWGRAAGVVAVCAAVGVVIVVGHRNWVSHSHEQLGTAPPWPQAQASSSVVAAPPVVLPTSTETLQTVALPTPSPAADADEQYLAALKASGIVVVDPVAATAGGRAVCVYLKQGHSQAEAVALGMRNNPGISPMDAIHAMTDAVLAYCPEMNRR